MIRVYDKTLRLMGNRFQISAVADKEDWANQCIGAAVAEISRIERMLTTYNDDSETAAINRMAGISPVKVSEECFGLIERSLRISAITQGAFDLSYGSADKKLWNFDVTMSALPEPAALSRSVRLIDYRNILLEPERREVFLKNPGMRIGFGGIGKGYAADRARELMKSMGVESGVVNASGDLTAWGNQPSGKPWSIGIAHPDAKEQIFSTMSITDMAVATSGNYEKYVMIGDNKYSHTIDPRTGMPIRGIKSVTIISPSGELSDAMATPVMIMGIGPALNMINQIPGIEAIIVDDRNNLYKSDNIRFN